MRMESLILFLSLALAEVYLLHTNDTLTVLFVLDRSESIPVQKDPSDEKRDLVEFLKSLTDPGLLKEPRWSDPWRR